MKLILEIIVAIILISLTIGYFVAGFLVAIFLYDDSGNETLRKYSWIITPLISLLWLPGIIILACWCFIDSYIDIVRNIIQKRKS